MSLPITLTRYVQTVHDEPPHPAHTRTSTASTSTADTPASPLSPSIEILGNLTLQNVAAGSLLGAGFQQGEPALAPHARIPSSRDARPLSSLLSSPRVRLAVANYGMLSLLDIALNALLPVVLASAIRLGGLGRSPETIGALMGTFGLVNGIVQATVFTRVVRRVGLRTTFTAGICSYFGIWTCFFGANWIARKMGASVGGPLPAVVWAVFAAQNVLTMLMDMSFGERAAICPWRRNALTATTGCQARFSSTLPRPHRTSARSARRTGSRSRLARPSLPVLSIPSG